MEKVILILVDGMRPDAMEACGNPYLNKLKANATYCMTTRTVMPSVTLPCHMSLFHSVNPDRHGVLTNLYTPQVRPIKGLFNALHDAGRSTAMFYSWEELRDLGRPGSLDYSLFCSQSAFEHSGKRLTDDLIAFWKENQPDFSFLYLGEPDEVGHGKGWMTDDYLASVSEAMDCTKTVIEELDDRCTVIVTADHGGHDRTHGTECQEDMTIPLFFLGKAFEKGKSLAAASILDIAPTVARLLEITCPREWEGTTHVE